MDRILIVEDDDKLSEGLCRALATDCVTAEGSLSKCLFTKACSMRWEQL